jgi:hypothetical protein
MEHSGMKAIKALIYLKRTRTTKKKRAGKTAMETATTITGPPATKNTNPISPTQYSSGTRLQATWTP